MIERAPEMKERLARLLIKAEHYRSLAKGLLSPDRPFPDPVRWLKTSSEAKPKDHRGPHLVWKHEGTTLEVRMQRAPCNEIGSELLSEFEHLAAYLEDGAGGARCVLFHSALTTGFSAGADLRELYQGIKDRRDSGTPVISQVRELREFIDRIHRVFDVFDTVPITTVAAVHGVCFGGGFELALTCDQIIAEKSARFCFPELRLGLVPGFGGVPRLRRDLGNAVVRDLLLSGRSLRAKRAFEVGLVSQVVARGEALNAARSLAEQVAKFDPHTTAAAKSFIKPFPKKELDREKEVFTLLFASPVVEESLARFVNNDTVQPYLP